MGLVSSARRLLGFGSPSEKRATPDAPTLGNYAYNYFSDTQLKANSTVQACSNVIANSVSILPLNLYFKDPKTGARQKAGWHPVYSLLKTKPNPMESPVIFYGKIMRGLLEKGGVFIWKNYVGGKVASLHVLNFESVTIRYTGLLPSYYYNGKDCTQSIIYISSLIVDDFGKGYAPVEFARAAITLGLALDEFSLSAFQNGLNSKMFVDISDTLADEGVKDIETAQKRARIIRDFLASQYAGSANAGKPLVGLNKLKVTELTHQNSFKDAELLDSRKHQDGQICRIFGVPQFLIDSTVDVKYGKREEALADYLNFTLMPYLLHIANRLGSELLTAYEQDAYYLEFDFNVLNRPSAEARATIYGKLLDVGAISPNQICAAENMEGLGPVGDYHWIPAQKMPLTQENIDAYMAGQKEKLASMSFGGADPKQADPSLAAGSQAQ